MQLDYLRKELVTTYHWSNVLSDRNCLSKETVNGRTIYVEGEVCAKTIIGLLYKVYSPGKKHFNYVLHVGVAHQGNMNQHVDIDEEYERAYVEALMNPIELTTNSMICPDNLWVTIVHKIVDDGKAFVLTEEESNLVNKFFAQNSEIKYDTLYGLHPIKPIKNEPVCERAS